MPGVSSRTRLGPFSPSFHLLQALKIIKLALFIQVAETTHASFVDKSLDLMCDDYPVYYYAYYTICDFYKTAANMIVSTFNKKHSLLENISVSFFGHQQFTTYPLSNSLN